MWDKLDNVNEQQLANYLKNEYPQTIAVVMAKLKPERAAKVIESLPESLSMEAIDRMLNLEFGEKKSSTTWKKPCAGNSSNPIQARHAICTKRLPKS